MTPFRLIIPPMTRTSIILYATYVLLLGISCFRAPIQGDFDRFMYEAVVRTARHEDVRQVYESIKLESPRMAESSRGGWFDSVDHFVKLEPLYRVKPLYLWLVRAISGKYLTVQTSISLISATSVCALGFIFLRWTHSPWSSALLLASPAAMELGRSGSPDALSAVLVMAGLWAIKKDHPNIGMSVLVVAVWLRTDDVLVLCCVCVWLLLSKRATTMAVSLSGIAGLLSVFLVNRLCGSYGWSALFRVSFIGGHPGEVTNSMISVREYMPVFFSSAFHLLPQIAIYLFVGVVAWRISRAERDMMAVVAAAAILHYVLFPSPEQRYMLWACLTTGIALILSVNCRTSTSSSDLQHPVDLMGGNDCTHSDAEMYPSSHN